MLFEDLVMALVTGKLTVEDLKNKTVFVKETFKTHYCYDFTNTTSEYYY